MGMIRYAHEFMEAALAVDDQIGGKPGFEIVAPIPALYLMGHSIELTLKAFLLQNGVAPKKLRNFGHDLHASSAKRRSSNFLL